MPLPLLCKKSGAIPLVLMSLTTGSPRRQAGSQMIYWLILKFPTNHTVRIFTAFSKGTCIFIIGSFGFG